MRATVKMLGPALGLAAGLAMALGLGARTATGQDGSEELPKILAEADVHLRTKSYGAAVKVLERALKLAPKSFDAHYKMGQAFEKLENERAALDHYEQASKLRPDNLDAQFKYGSMLVATGQTTKAMKPLERVYKDKPDTPGLRASLGRLYYESGDLKRSRTFLKKAIKEDKKNWELRYYYAECLFRLERYDEATPMLERAAEEARTARTGLGNDIYNKAANRALIAKRRIRTFGLIEGGGRRFRNKAFKCTVTKPIGYRWGWYFPQQLPPRLVFALHTDDGQTLVQFESFNQNSNYTVANRSVKPQELEKFFDATKKDLENKHKKIKKLTPVRLLRQAKKQFTFAFTAQRKSDLKKIDQQITQLQLDNQTFQLTITCPQGQFKKQKREIEAILKTIKFDKK